MIRRLNSNIAYALIASAIGLSGIGVASAADTSTAAATPAMPSTSTAPAADPTAAGASTTPSAGAGTASDSTMAPRGANPSTTTNATANGAAAADSPAKRIFDQLDTNHDGSLSLEEFSRATFQQPAKQ